MSAPRRAWILGTGRERDNDDSTAAEISADGKISFLFDLMLAVVLWGPLSQGDCWQLEFQMLGPERCMGLAALLNASPVATEGVRSNFQATEISLCNLDFGALV
jgi:hypothetical protein